MPPAPGAVAMAAMVDPCIVVPFCPGPLAAGAMGCWGPPGGQSCRENALSDFTAYFTTFFRKKIHPPMGFSTSSEILVGKAQKNYFNFVVPESLRTAWGSIFTGGFSPGRLRPFSDILSPPHTTKPGGPLRTARLCVKRSCYSSILPKLKSAKSSTRSVRLGATGAAVSASRGA